MAKRIGSGSGVLPPQGPGIRPNETCSFCGRMADQVERLIA